MANFNKVFLMGNMTRDPEVRYTPNGTAVCEFGLAVNRQWTGPDGQKKDETCFVDCQMWGRRGEVVAEYFRKGRPIFIEGRLQFDQWEGRDGQRRSKLRVVAENFEFIGGRGEGGGGGGRGENAGGGRGESGGGGRGESGGRANRGAGGGGQGSAPPQARRPQGPPPPPEDAPPPPSDADGFDVQDDDIPF